MKKKTQQIIEIDISLNHILIEGTEKGIGPTWYLSHVLKNVDEIVIRRKK